MYSFKINDIHIKSFLEMLLEKYHSTELNEIIHSAQPRISWDTYWDFDDNVHNVITKALLRMSELPNTEQLTRILQTEKLKWPINNLFDREQNLSNSIYFSRGIHPLEEPFTGAFKALTLDRFLHLKKKFPVYISLIVRYASPEQLPLLIGDPAIRNGDLKVLEAKLKGS